MGRETYIGPTADSSVLREFLRLVSQTFMVERCNKPKPFRWPPSQRGTGLARMQVLADCSNRKDHV